MADAIELGNRPGRLTVWFSPWGDFWAGLDSVNPDDMTTPVDWAAGVVPQLEFYATPTSLEPLVTWVAEITGPHAEWYKPMAEVRESIIDPDNVTARLVLLADGKRLVWEEGKGRWTSA